MAKLDNIELILMDMYSHQISPPLPSPVLQSQPTLLPPSSVLSSQLPDPVPILHVPSQPSLTSIPQQSQSSASQDFHSPSEMELFFATRRHHHHDHRILSSNKRFRCTKEELFQEKFLCQSCERALHKRADENIKR